MTKPPEKRELNIIISNSPDAPRLAASAAAAAAATADVYSVNSVASYSVAHDLSLKFREPMTTRRRPFLERTSGDTPD